MAGKWQIPLNAPTNVSTPERMELADCTELTASYWVAYSWHGAYAKIQVAILC